MKEGRALRWRSRRTAAENAARELPALARDYFAAGRQTAGSDDAAALHRFRIRTKRLRYTLELFAPCYGAAMTRRLSSLRAVQQCLGELNDLAVIAALVEGHAEAAAVAGRRAAKAAEFTRLWAAFDRRGAEPGWVTFLSRPKGLSGGATV